MGAVLWRAWRLLWGLVCSTWAALRWLWHAYRHWRQPRRLRRVRQWAAAQACSDCLVSFSPRGGCGETVVAGSSRATDNRGPRRPAASSGYPPPDVVLQLAHLTSALPGASPRVWSRLQSVQALAARQGWPEDALAAVRYRQLDWATIARHVGRGCSMSVAAAQWLGWDELLRLLQPEPAPEPIFPAEPSLPPAPDSPPSLTVATPGLGPRAEQPGVGGSATMEATLAFEKI